MAQADEIRFKEFRERFATEDEQPEESSAWNLSWQMHQAPALSGRVLLPLQSKNVRRTALLTPD